MSKLMTCLQVCRILHSINLGLQIQGYNLRLPLAIEDSFLLGWFVIPVVQTEWYVFLIGSRQRQNEPKTLVWVRIPARNSRQVAILALTSFAGGLNQLEKRGGNYCGFQFWWLIKSYLVVNTLKKKQICSIFFSFSCLSPLWNCYLRCSLAKLSVRFNEHFVILPKSTSPKNLKTFF